jgi:hypothetical protein
VSDVGVLDLGGGSNGSILELAGLLELKVLLQQRKERMDFWQVLE